METTKNNLPPDVKAFFKDLSDYLGTKILFFGSVQRSDYIPGKSDIDVDIFTDNENSTLAKLKGYLGTKREKVKKVVWTITETGKTVYGYKLSYKNEDETLRVEFSVYNDKFQDAVTKEHQKKFVIPFYCTVMLWLLKLLYYQLNIISNDTFRYYKNLALTVCIGYPENEFIILEPK